MNSGGSLLVGLLLSALHSIAAAQASSAIETLKPSVRARVTCSIAAATRFGVPANLVIAVAEQEGGRVGQWVENKNGSYDVGPMQFNSSYLRTLARFGITPQDVEAAGCYPYELAAWRLQHHLRNDAGDLWTRAANYHSRTPRFNARYRAAIRARAATWAQWLAEHVPTVEIALPESPVASDPPPLPTARSQRKPPLALRHAMVRGKRAGGSVDHGVPARQAVQPRDGVLDELAAINAQRHTELLKLVSRRSR